MKQLAAIRLVAESLAVPTHLAAQFIAGALGATNEQDVWATVLDPCSREFTMFVLLPTLDVFGPKTVSLISSGAMAPCTSINSITSCTGCTVRAVARTSAVIGTMSHANGSIPLLLYAAGSRLLPPPPALSAATIPEGIAVGGSALELGVYAVQNSNYTPRLLLSPASVAYVSLSPLPPTLLRSRLQSILRTIARADGIKVDTVPSRVKAHTVYVTLPQRALRPLLEAFAPAPIVAQVLCEAEVRHVHSIINAVRAGTAPAPAPAQAPAPARLAAATAWLTALEGGVQPPPAAAGEGWSDDFLRMYPLSGVTLQPTVDPTLPPPSQWTIDAAVGELRRSQPTLAAFTILGAVAVQPLAAADGTPVPGLYEVAYTSYALRWPALGVQSLLVGDAPVLTGAPAGRGAVAAAAAGALGRAEGDLDIVTGELACFALVNFVSSLTKYHHVHDPALHITSRLVVCENPLLVRELFESWGHCPLRFISAEELMQMFAAGLEGVSFGQGPGLVRSVVVPTCAAHSPDNGDHLGGTCAAGQLRRLLNAIQPNNAST